MRALSGIGEPLDTPAAPSHRTDRTDQTDRTRRRGARLLAIHSLDSDHTRIPFSRYRSARSAWDGKPGWSGVLALRAESTCCPGGGPGVPLSVSLSPRGNGARRADMGGLPARPCGHGRAVTYNRRTSRGRPRGGRLDGRSEPAPGSKGLATLNLNLITSVDPTGYGYAGRAILYELIRAGVQVALFSMGSSVFLGHDPRDPIRFAIANAARYDPRAERPARAGAVARRARRPRQARRVSDFRGRSI